MRDLWMPDNISSFADFYTLNSVELVQAHRASRSTCGKSSTRLRQKLLLEYSNVDKIPSLPYRNPLRTPKGN